MFAANRRSLLSVIAGGTLLLGALTACGGEGSSGTTAPPSGAAGAGCAPVAGDELVVLTDDKQLQKSDNVVAAVNAAKSSPALIAATDKVAAALDTPKLLALNKAVEVDRKTPAQTAQDFATANNLTAGLSGGSGAVVVGYANFAESQTLAELYKIVLSAAGFSVTTKASNNREIYLPALEKGELTVFPEYAATLTGVLNKNANGESAANPSSGDINVTMAALKDLGGKAGLTFGTPSAAADQNAFAVTKAFAAKNAVKTMSEFAAKCSGAATILAGPAECPQRDFCQLGLQNVYKLTVGKFTQTDAGGPQTKTAVKTGVATIGLVFSTDSSLSAA
jgi:osmoprotectant transport system substrate-binding protein